MFRLRGVRARIGFIAAGAAIVVLVLGLVSVNALPTGSKPSGSLAAVVPSARPTSKPKPTTAETSAPSPSTAGNPHSSASTAGTAVPSPSGRAAASPPPQAGRLVDLTFTGAFKAHITEAIRGPICSRTFVQVIFALSGKIDAKYVSGRERLDLKTGHVSAIPIGGEWVAIVGVTAHQVDKDRRPRLVDWIRTTGRPGPARWSGGVLKLHDYQVWSSGSADLRVSGSITCW